MRALKINFGGANQTSIDWNSTVDGLSAVAQRAGVAMLTHEGSDKFLPSRGTDVAATLIGYGAFDLMGIQHVLNFGALKARSDMREFETPDRADVDRVGVIKATLMNVENRLVSIALRVTNQAGESSREILSIA